MFHIAMHADPRKASIEQQLLRRVKLRHLTTPKGHQMKRMHSVLVEGPAQEVLGVVLTKI